MTDSSNLSTAQGAAEAARRRSATIVKTSVIGIAANIMLAAFKAAVGFASHSIAIVMDAVNNLSDAASSVITIVGARLAGREADRKHPFGYGRVEYLSAMVISLLVLYAGVTAFTESVKKIIHPDVPDYSAVTLIVVAVAVAVKLVLGRYVKGVGERVRSDSLINSGEDASLDAIISASTLLAAAVHLFFHVSLEAWLGAVIALVIVKSGFEMLRDTLSQILGEHTDAALSKRIKETVASHPGVRGAYDLVLHDYGPDAYNGSVHIEVSDTLRADELDALVRQITADVYQTHNVLLTAVGVYAVNTHDTEAVTVRETVESIVLSHEHVLQMHGFYLNKTEKLIRFDMVVSFNAPDRRQVYQNVTAQVQRAFPDYTILAAMDTDFTGA